MLWPVCKFTEPTTFSGNILFVNFIYIKSGYNDFILSVFPIPDGPLNITDSPASIQFCIISVSVIFTLLTGLDLSGFNFCNLDFLGCTSCSSKLCSPTSVVFIDCSNSLEKYSSINVFISVLSKSSVR